MASGKKEDKEEMASGKKEDKEEMASGKKEEIYEFLMKGGLQSQLSSSPDDFEKEEVNLNIDPGVGVGVGGVGDVGVGGEEPLYTSSPYDLSSSNMSGGSEVNLNMDIG